MRLTRYMTPYCRLDLAQFPGGVGGGRGGNLVVVCVEGETWYTVYVLVSVSICVYLYVCMYVCIRIYIYIAELLPNSIEISWWGRGGGGVTWWWCVWWGKPGILYMYE